MKYFIEVLNGSAYLTHVSSSAVEVTEEQAQFALQNPHDITIEEILAMERTPNEPTLDDLKSAKLLDLQVVSNAIVQTGYSDAIEGVILAMGETDKNDFSSHLVAIGNAESCGMITAQSVVMYKDIAKNLHSITVGSYRQLLARYSAYVTEVWVHLSEIESQINACQTAEELEGVVIE